MTDCLQPCVWGHPAAAPQRSLPTVRAAARSHSPSSRTRPGVTPLRRSLLPPESPVQPFPEGNQAPGLQAPCAGQPRQARCTRDAGRTRVSRLAGSGRPRGPSGGRRVRELRGRVWKGHCRVQAALAQLCCCDLKELRCDRLRTTENKNHTEMPRVMFVCVRPSSCAPLMQQWASRPPAHPGCCRQCSCEHWGTCADFEYGFLRVYVQQWDCWVIR